MFRLSLWLNLAAVACVAWGIYGGYTIYQREIGRVHAQMRVRYEKCASQVYETHAYEDHRVQLLTTQCVESLDDDRWVPILAPNLTRDTFIAGFGPALLALLLSALPFLTARWVRPARVPKSAGIVR